MDDHELYQKARDILADELASLRTYVDAEKQIKDEIAEMVGDGNDPDLTALERTYMPDTHDYYNAGRIAGLRLALDILEGRV